MPSRSQLLQGLAVILCAAMSLVAATCGSSATKRNVPADAAAPNIILPSDISAAPAASPERALLSWVQAIQFRDTARVLQLTEPAVVARTGSPAVSRAVQTLGPQFGRPQIVNGRIQGRRAILHVLLLSYVGQNTKPALSIPMTVLLTRVSNSWRIADLGPLFPKGVPQAKRNAAPARAKSGASSVAAQRNRSSAGAQGAGSTAAPPSGGSAGGAQSGGSAGQAQSGGSSAARTTGR